MTITIEKINQPGHWTNNKYRVHKHIQGTGHWRYFDSALEAQEYRQSICPHYFENRICRECGATLIDAVKEAVKESAAA